MARSFRSQSQASMRRSASSGSGLRIDAGLAGEAAALRRLDDQPRQPLAAAAIEAVSLRIFVDQPLELARVAGQVRADERRRQMAERHRGDPALGLRGFARIADDERIDDRQRPDHGLGEAGRRQRDGLARQPFQRAVRAHVDDGIDIGDVTEPQPEGEQRVARRQGRIVIVGAATVRTAAIRRQGDDDVAEYLARGSGTRRRARRDRPRARPRRRRSSRRQPTEASQADRDRFRPASKHDRRRSSASSSAFDDTRRVGRPRSRPPQDRRAAH